MRRAALSALAELLVTMGYTSQKHCKWSRKQDVATRVIKRRP